MRRADKTPKGAKWEKRAEDGVRKVKKKYNLHTLTNENLLQTYITFTSRLMCLCWLEYKELRRSGSGNKKYGGRHARAQSRHRVGSEFVTSVAWPATSSVVVWGPHLASGWRYCDDGKGGGPGQNTFHAVAAMARCHPGWSFPQFYGRSNPDGTTPKYILFFFTMSLSTKALSS